MAYRSTWQSEHSPLLSVVVPYVSVIGRARQSCLEVLKLAQCQLVLVNDTGSIRPIPHGLALRTFDASVVNESNMGPGASRNVGLSVCTGSFVTFLDSDDELDVLAAIDLCLEANGGASDLVLAAVAFVDRDGISRVRDPKTKQSEAVLGYAALIGRAAVWGKVYRRQFLNQCGIAFPCWRGGEDVAFSLSLALADPSWAVSSRVIYTHYFDRPDSLTATPESRLSAAKGLNEIAARSVEGGHDKALVCYATLTGSINLIRRGENPRLALKPMLTSLRSQGACATWKAVSLAFERILARKP